MIIMFSVLQFFFRQRFLLITALLLAVLQLQSCNKPTEPDKPTIYPYKLTLEDASCTELWITIERDETINTIDTVKLLKDNNYYATYPVAEKKQTVYVDTLLPGKEYLFTLFKGEEQLSYVTTLKTLDTTSHNFTWQTFEFGEHSSSALYDVAIIDENNIWAVGEIYMKDSLGNYDHNAYNAVHWDGQKWELKRINMLSDCNPVIYPPLRTIWAFDNKKMAVCSGGSIGWFDGIGNITDCGIRPLLTGAINKLWGSSPNDLYAVGNGGNIAHWNGSSWKKIESGTSLDIFDIWGDKESQKQSEVICIASHLTTNLGKKVVKINGGSVEDITTKGLPWSLSGLWFIPKKRYYIAGDGLYYCKNLEDGWTRVTSLPSYYMTSIRGSNINDIFIVGAYGLLLHYNGFTWKSFQNTSYFNGAFGQIAIKDNRFIAVGSTVNGKAKILLGKR